MTDFIIVGAGPSGLATAWKLAQAGKNCIVVDRELEIGGCHRVRRTKEGDFQEHGPRIYSTSYVNTMAWFSEMGMDFYDLFVPYHFSIFSIGGKTFASLQWWEKLALAKGFFTFLIMPGLSSQETVQEFMEAHSFSAQSRDYIDRVCRLTDGTGADRYTMFRFFQILNQNLLNQLYQPRDATDRLLFPLIKAALQKTGRIQFRLGTQVTGLLRQGEEIVGVRAKNETFLGKVVLAIPPKNIFQLLPPQDPTLEKWAKETSYFTYVPITFHWNQKLRLPDVHGFPESDWGIAFIILSNYFESQPGTLISTAITLPDRKSTVTGKTANETSDPMEIKAEVFRQLKETLEIPDPDKVLISPALSHNGTQWVTRDEAFVDTDPFHLPVRWNGVFTVGTQNGYSLYDFTSLESAVSNALVASSIILDKPAPQLKRPRELKQVLLLLLIFLGVFLLLR